MTSKIDLKTAGIGIIGLGYVGVPLVVEFCKAGFQTLGFDVDQEKIDALTVGESYIRHIDPSTIAQCGPRFLPTCDFSRLSEVDFEATVAAATTPDIAGNFINVACGGSHTLLSLIDVVSRSLGKGAAPAFQPLRVGDVKHSYADITEAKRLLGYEPAVSLEEGIKLMIEQEQTLTAAHILSHDALTPISD